MSIQTRREFIKAVPVTAGALALGGCAMREPSASTGKSPALSAEPRPGLFEYPIEVPFSAPQNFIDHARFFQEEMEMIQIGPYMIWNFNTPNRGFGNVADVQALHAVFDRPAELPAPHTALR